MRVKGPMKVDWGNALPFAVIADANTAALQTKVDNGTAITTSGVTLADESAKLQVESRVAIGTLFAAVKLGFDTSGAPTLGGSLGDTEGFVTVTWDPMDRAAVFEAERNILRFIPTSFGADVTLTGKLFIQLKIKAQDAEEPASVVAHLAVVLPALYLGGVVITSVIELAGAEAVYALARQALIKLVPEVLLWTP